MKTHIFNLFIVSIIGLATQSSVFALGSYMFCVNKHNPHDWKWAPPQPEDKRLNGYYISSDQKGTWIYGRGTYNKHLHSVLLLDNETLGNSLCNTLADVCTDAYGPDYSYIGASGHAVAQASWSYIMLNTKCFITGSGLKIHKICTYVTCPNWNYPNGAEEQSLKW